MDSLPIEIRIKIVDSLGDCKYYTPRSAVSSLRQVSKQWYEVASESLFETVAIWFSLSSLQYLNNIAEHPLL